MLIPLAAALLPAALLAIPTSNTVLAQSPPSREITLVNADREFVERKGGGQFVARPIFDRQVEALYYAVRDADTGDWITAMYQVRGGEKEGSDGWEYSWEYPALHEQPDLDKDRAYLLVMLVRETASSDPQAFHAVVPIHQPGTHLGQDPRRPQPRPLGQGLRGLDHRGHPRDPLRRG